MNDMADTENRNSPHHILANSRIRKPLICGLCKSEFVSDAPIRNKCEHPELSENICRNGPCYEVLTKNFEITLDKVEKHCESLNMNIYGTEQKLAAYYNKIREDINRKLNAVIDGLLEEKRLLFEEIDNYQNECDRNFITCTDYKKDLLEFLETINKSTWNWRRMNKADPGEEILEGFKKAYSYKIELERKKIQYESFIFNKKIDFRPCPLPEGPQIGSLTKIIDNLPAFNQWIKIDLKQTLFLNLTKEKSIKHPYLIIEEFESKNLFCCYVYTNSNMFGISQIKLVVADSNGHYLRSINEKTYDNEFKVFKFKDLILVSLYSKIGHSNLKIFDENLNRIYYMESLPLMSPITSLYATENYIYFTYLTESAIEETHQTVIYALDWNLDYVESTNLNNASHKMTFPFSFPNNVDQIECFDSKIYLKYENTITVVSEETGEVMKVLDIPCASDMAIDMSGFFVIFCHMLKKIFYLNLNCDILDENELIEFPTNLKFYYNKYQRTLYFYDTAEYLLYKLKNDTRLFKNSIHWYLVVNQ